jgi:arylsulfatase A-like enzyme
VIDIVPTLLEATGISAPEQVNGIKQKGTSKNSGHREFVGI